MKNITKVVIVIIALFFMLIMIPFMAIFGGVGNYSSTPTASVLPPAQLIPTYVVAGAKYHVPWWFLATINKIETNYNSGNMVSSADALGPMQFLYTTYQEYGKNVTKNPNEPKIGTPFDFVDAVFASAKMFHKLGMPQKPNQMDIAHFAGAYNAGASNWDNMSTQTVNYRAMAVQYSQEIKKDVTVPAQDIAYWESLPLKTINLIAEKKKPIYGAGTSQLPKIVILTSGINGSKSV